MVLPLLLFCAIHGAAAGLEGGLPGSRQILPDPVINPHSTEICLNSRISYHGGWSGSVPDQVLANVLHAAAAAPVTGTSRTIYVATSAGVYIYDPENNSLSVHRTGDWRSDATAAFEVGVAAQEIIDAGAAIHLAQLEASALWTGTVNQLASCPRASATTYANANWEPTDPVNLAISFGLRSVPGLTSTLVATSSDGSLPDPETDGSVYLDTTLQELAYGSAFTGPDLTLEEVSRILWASYGCSDHRAAGSKGGLTCASAVANYYLTRRIYWIGPDGVYRYHNRLPPGTDATTRDHRIESIQPGDARPALRQGVAELPDAPGYLVLCVGSISDWPLLEIGFAAMGAMLEASAINLQADLAVGLTVDEQAGIRGATSIPAGDIPWAVVSLGHPLHETMVPDQETEATTLALVAENLISSGGPVVVHYELPQEAAVDLTVNDCRGHEVACLIRGRQARGSQRSTWDGQDSRGQPVASGVYFVRLRAGAQETSTKVVIVR